MPNRPYILTPCLKLTSCLIIMLGSLSLAHASKIDIAPKLIAGLVKEHCANAIPKLSATTTESLPLDYECFDDPEDKLDTAYGLELIPLVVKDFNEDGFKDITIEVRSSGPLGESVYTNSSIYYLLLNENMDVVDEHSILLYALFSEHIVSYAVEDNHIVYEARPEAYDGDGNLIESIKVFEINWPNHQPITSYYQNNCRLASLNPKLPFKKMDAIKYNSGIGMHDYERYQIQQVEIDKLDIYASLTGCNKIKIAFNVQPQKDKPLPVLASINQLLLDMTNYKKPLSDLQTLERQGKMAFGQTMQLNDDWDIRVHIDRTSTVPNLMIQLTERDTKLPIELPQGMEAEVTLIDFDGNGIDDKIYFGYSPQSDTFQEYWFKDDGTFFLKLDDIPPQHFYRFADLDNDGDNEAILIRGWEDGSDAQVANIDFNDPSLETLFYFKPYVYQEGKTYWGYAWDLDNLIMDDDGKILSAYQTYANDDFSNEDYRYAMGQHQTQLPILLFSANENYEPQWEDESLRNISYQTLDQIYKFSVKN